MGRATESGLSQSDWDNGVCARVGDRGVRRSQALGGGREGFPGEVTPVLKHERGAGAGQVYENEKIPEKEML